MLAGNHAGSNPVIRTRSKKADELWFSGFFLSDYCGFTSILLNIISNALSIVSLALDLFSNKNMYSSLTNTKISNYMNKCEICQINTINVDKLYGENYN